MGRPVKPPSAYLRWAGILAPEVGQEVYRHDDVAVQGHPQREDDRPVGVVEKVRGALVVVALEPGTKFEIRREMQYGVEQNVLRLLP